MSRSGYSDDYDGDNPSYLLYPSVVQRAINGKRGQAFLVALRDALEAIPEKKLIAHDLQAPDGVCAIGCLGVARGLDMSKIDPDDVKTVSEIFDIAPALVREVTFENDDDFNYRPRETPEQRYTRMLNWVKGLIRSP